MKSTDIESYNLRTPFPALFASKGTEVENPVNSANSGFTYIAGIPSTYSSMTGKKVDRKDMNGIGRLISQSRWFNQQGGYYTFDQTISDAIGGYPVGAILYYKEPNSGYIRPVRSLISDNNYNFVEDPSFINNLYWSYVDTFLPTSLRPRIFIGSKREGIINSDGASISVDNDSLLIMQTGIKDKDSMEGADATSWFLEVKRHNEDTFYTAAMVGFLPPLGTCAAQGNATFVLDERVADKGQSAFYSSSPIQAYLSAGDEFRVVCSTNRGGIITLRYQCFELTS